MAQPTNLTVEQWETKYKPITNHLDPQASWQSDGDGTGIMFETYGAELAFVDENVDIDCVWTYGDGDDGGLYLTAGKSYVNRIGYFVTEVPWENLSITVTVQEGCGSGHDWLEAPSGDAECSRCYSLRSDVETA